MNFYGPAGSLPAVSYYRVLQTNSLSPDFFFQKHIYRADGGTVLLPPGEFTMEASRVCGFTARCHRNGIA